MLPFTLPDAPAYAVTTVMTEAGGQNTYGVVDPACDVDGLSQVFIVTDYEIVE